MTGSEVQSFFMAAVLVFLIGKIQAYVMVWGVEVPLMWKLPVMGSIVFAALPFFVIGAVPLFFFELWSQSTFAIVFHTAVAGVPCYGFARAFKQILLREGYIGAQGEKLALIWAISSVFVLLVWLFAAKGGG